MSGPVKQFIDYANNTNNDTGENNTSSILPILNGNPVDAANLSRPDESLRQRTEAVKNALGDTLYLRDADRALVIAGPGAVTWPGSTTVAASGIPVITNVLHILPMLTPGFAQTLPVPPIASAFGTLHLKRADSLNAILVTSQRRSYAAGDQISIDVVPGGAFSITLDVETGYRRTIHIVATGATQLSTVITALNALLPPAPDNTQLVTAALEGGALGTDLLLTTQAKQFVVGNYDGEGHTITPANLAAFFTANPGSALAEGDTLCIQFEQVTDTASTGGRRQALPENSNTAVPVGSFFNSRVHPDRLVNALPICKVVSGQLVFGTGTEIPAGSTATPLSSSQATNVSYGGGGNWADGTTNPATTVEGQLDKVITDLAGATGTGKIQGSVVGTDLAAGTLAAQIIALATNWFKLSRVNTVSAQNTFTALQDFQKRLTLGTGLITTNADVDTARQTHSAVTAKLTLLWESISSVLMETWRVYADATAGGFPTLMFTSNAKYDNAAALWSKDDTGQPSHGYVMRGGGYPAPGFQLRFQPAGPGTWSSWSTAGRIEQNLTDGFMCVDPSGNTLRLGAASGILDFGNSSGGQTNPSNVSGNFNKLRAKNIPKAWAQLQLIFGGGVTVVDGFNITGATRVNGSYTPNAAVQVSFATAMASAAYAVQLSNIKLNVDSVCFPYIASQANTNFVIHANDTGNVEVDLSSNWLNPYIYFTVFGQQGT